MKKKPKKMTKSLKQALAFIDKQIAICNKHENALARELRLVAQTAR